MKKNLLLYLAFLLLLVFTNALNGQTKSDFEKIFLKETEEKGTGGVKHESFKHIEKISFYPDTLPGWFFSLPSGSTNAVYAIGISDPDMPREEAEIQAFFRAKTMAVILHNSKLQYFKDIYTTEQSDGKQQKYRQRYDTYFKVSASTYSSSKSYTIVNKHFTKFNEAIMLIRFQPDEPQGGTTTDKELFTSIGTVFFIEAQVEEAFEPQAEYKLTSEVKRTNQQILSSDYTFISKGNEFLSQSIFLGNEIDYPYYPYRYANALWAENTQPMVAYTGLWSIISTKFLKQLMQGIESSSVKIRSMGQQYNPEITNLTREVAIKNVKIILNGIEFGRDDIDFNVVISDL